MTNVPFLQRGLWFALAAAAPYAFYRLARTPVVPFDGQLALDEDDVYDNLRDGEVAAAG